MKLLLIGFLTVISLGCTSSKPKPPIPFKGKWTMIEITPDQMSGCLNQEDMIKFREYQYACEENKKVTCE